MIMSVVTEGYKIPFIEFPPPMFYRNNNSSLNEISDKGVINELPFKVAVMSFDADSIPEVCLSKSRRVTGFSDGCVI